MNWFDEKSIADLKEIQRKFKDFKLSLDFKFKDFKISKAIFRLLSMKI